jgi:hypothetical protein
MTSHGSEGTVVSAAGLVQGIVLVTFGGQHDLHQPQRL